MHQEEKKECRSASGATTNAAGETKMETNGSDSTGEAIPLVMDESFMLISGIDLIRNLTSLNIKKFAEGKSICSVLRILENEKEIIALTKRASPESGFHHNPATVKQLVDCLKYWTQCERVLTVQDSLRQAMKMLDQRFANNLCFVIKM